MSKIFHPFKITLCLLFLTLCVNAQSDRDVLLKGVLAIPVSDSNMVAASFITNNIPEVIAVAKLDPTLSLKSSVILTSRLALGKIMCLGSVIYFEKKWINNIDVKKFIENTLIWAGNKKSNLLIGLWGKFDNGLETAFPNNKFYSVKNQFIRKNTSILFLNEDVRDSIKLKQLETFVKNGGTLIFGSPYDKIYKNRDSSKPYTESLIKINELLIKAGIFNAFTLIAPTKESNKLIIDSIPEYLSPKTLFPYLIKTDYDKLDYLTKAYAIDITLQLIIGYNELNSTIISQMKSAFAISDRLPTLLKLMPIPIKTNQQKWAYVLGNKLNEKKLIDNDLVKADGYQIFPGEVNADAKRIKANINIPVNVGHQGLSEPQSVFYRPQSTGFYVPAGEKVKITIGNELLSQNLKAEIGVHHDDLMQMDELNRIGFDLTKSFDLNKAETEIFSPYGGLLTIKVADTSLLKSITLTIAGAVKSPYFKLNETSEEDWKNIRNNPGPWAELATDKIVLTVPSYRIRKLDNPIQLMKFWDEVMDADADLAIINRNRVNKERIIVDEQVSYGYMFTAPDRIVVPDDESCEWMLDEDKMRSIGSWGHFHELGHRHQFWEMDFEGTGEVTVNLYSMYIYDQVLKKGIYNHENISSKEVVFKRINKYLTDNPTFEKWKKDPFTALCMYIQLIENFGWEPIKEVHKVYRALPKNQYPKSEQEKLDLWFINICKATKVNLSSFFEIWKLPISADANKEVIEFRTWLPVEFSSGLMELK